MAKKILVKGSDEYKTTCRECGCKFTYQREDVRQQYIFGGSAVVACPHCGHLVAHFGMLFT